MLIGRLCTYMESLYEALSVYERLGFTSMTPHRISPPSLANWFLPNGPKETETAAGILH